MPKPGKQLESFYAKNRQEWREWLDKNHLTADGLWLIYYKKNSGIPSVSYDEAVEEALCFGWIDSKVNALDNERYKQVFSPRKPKSVWSKLNKQRVEKLIAQGLMTTSGLTKIEAAKQDGSWYTLDAIEALIIPADLKQAMEANETANRYFEGFSNSSKKSILFWIDSAKRPQTRLNRISQTVSAAAQNRNPLAR